MNASRKLKPRSSRSAGTRITRASAEVITEIDSAAAGDMASLTWRSREGQNDAVRFSIDLINRDANLDDAIQADAGETTTRTFAVADWASALWSE